MKIDVDYEVLHNAIRKFRNGQELSDIEKKSLLILISATQDDYYPNEHEYNKQIERVRILKNLDYDKNRKKWNRIMEQCTIFENEYM
ncbi:hypothetical protein [Abyssisolibacter fermentans]|uniref:hypothetical protein n=1 Tax=Abyssisolibacter fermentans TaxID=1766203 RepID=UPI00082F8F3B|nr:hypothetical protein [Abyssisolibacter fermentans]